MTRREVLDRLRARGFEARPYTLAYAVECGHVPRPESDGSGNFIYTDAHVEALAARMQKRREKATA